MAVLELIMKIIDFGVAGLQAGVHTTEDESGTTSYLPPEVLLRQKNAVAPAWDIWAMGVMLYAMVCG